MGTSGTRSGGLRKGQSPGELLGGLSGFLSSADMDLGVLLESPRGVSRRLEWGHTRALASRAVAAVSRFPSRGSRDQVLSLEAFPQGFPTRISHMAFPRATLV